MWNEINFPFQISTVALMKFENGYVTSSHTFLGMWPLIHAEIYVNSFYMMTSSNGNIFRVTGHLRGEFTGDRWIPHTKASDAELWCLLWSAPNKRLSTHCEAGNLRRNRAHYDVIVMNKSTPGEDGCPSGGPFLVECTSSIRITTYLACWLQSVFVYHYCLFVNTNRFATFMCGQSNYDYYLVLYKY